MILMMPSFSNRIAPGELLAPELDEPLNQIDLADFAFKHSSRPHRSLAIRLRDPCADYRTRSLTTYDTKS